MRFERDHMMLVLPYLFEENKENIKFIQHGRDLRVIQQLFNQQIKDHVYDKFCKALAPPLGEYHYQMGRNNLIDKIDKALGEYYYQMRRNNYYNSIGEGKFKSFCNENGFEDEDVQEELQETDGNESTLTDFFDDNFPFDNIP
eukprot:461112_1